MGEDLEVSITGGTGGAKDQVRVTISASSEIISLSVAVAVTGILVGSCSGFISIEFRLISSVVFRQQESGTVLVILLGQLHFLHSINLSILPDLY